MTCPSSRVLLEQICRNQLLDTKLRSRALDHATQCRACGVYLANHRMLSTGLTLLPQLILSGNRSVPSRGVETAVLEAYRKQFDRKRRLFAFRSAAAAMAACLVLVVLVRVAQWPRMAGGRAAPASEDFVSGAAVFTAESATDSAGLGGGKGSFVSLPFAEALGAEERAELQHVRVTRGELAAMGLPGADAPDPEEPVNAEIVVGEDGVPRAVRLLN